MTSFESAIAVIIRQKNNGMGMQSNSFYHMGGHNVGRDVVQAADYARRLIENANNRDSLSNAQIGELIESHIDHYDDTHTDPEGYGCGTLRDIVNEICKQC